VRYIDGTDSSFDALFGWNLAPWRVNPMSMSDALARYVIDSRSLLEGKTNNAINRSLPEDIAVYQYEWANPKPAVPVKALEIQSLGSYISYALLAVTSRGAK
jgi:hypothetical protein